MEKIKVNNIELAYARHGRGMPLVLLHGFPLDHHLWDDVVPFLEDTFDLILPDLRGFGESTITETSVTMEDYASDIAGLLDHLGLQKIALAGHSMGGYVALTFIRLYPERVHGFGLIASQIFADTPERREGRYKSAVEVAENGISGVVEAMTPKFTSDERWQSYAREVMNRQPATAYIAALKAMAERPDSTSLFASLKVPVVIIHGLADALIPVERAREAKRALPSAHLIELEGVGHLPMLEATKQTAEGLKKLV